MEPTTDQPDLARLLTGQLLLIPPGSITLRDDRIKRRWEVMLPPFRLARFPVTQELYFAVTQEQPSVFKGDQKPVETVSWMDAVRFCNSLSRRLGLKPCYVLTGSTVAADATANGYRLPTEAEWQYACQAGTPQIRYDELAEIAWYKQNSGGQTQEVGRKAPNEWGLYDMLGNVWEWCSDLYDTEVYGSYRIFRGGGWCDEARSCLATNRRRSHPTSFKIDDFGFRLAQSLISGEMNPET